MRATHRQPSARVCAQRAEPAFSATYPALASRPHRRRKANDFRLSSINHGIGTVMSEWAGHAHWSPAPLAAGWGRPLAVVWSSGCCGRVAQADALASVPVLSGTPVPRPSGRETSRDRHRRRNGRHGRGWRARPRPAQGNPGIDVTIAGAVRFTGRGCKAWRGASVPFTRRASRQRLAAYRLSRRRLADGIDQARGFDWQQTLAMPVSRAATARHLAMAFAMENVEFSVPELSVRASLSTLIVCPAARIAP